MTTPRALGLSSIALALASGSALAQPTSAHAIARARLWVQRPSYEIVQFWDLVGSDPRVQPIFIVNTSYFREFPNGAPTTPQQMAQLCAEDIHNQVMALTPTGVNFDRNIAIMIQGFGDGGRCDNSQGAMEYFSSPALIKPPSGSAFNTCQPHIAVEACTEAISSQSLAEIEPTFSKVARTPRSGLKSALFMAALLNANPVPGDPPP